MAGWRDYVTAQEGFNTEMGTAVDGIVADVAKLNGIITALQNSPDIVTPADQTRIDALQAAGVALAARVKAADDLTAPDAPPVDPPADPPADPPIDPPLDPQAFSARRR